MDLAVTVAAVPPPIPDLTPLRPEGAVQPAASANPDPAAPGSNPQNPVGETILAAADAVEQAPSLPALQLSVAAQEAALRQAALAPLLADLAQAMALPGLPDAVASAAAQLLALRVPLGTAPTEADIKSALLQASAAAQSASSSAVSASSSAIAIPPQGSVLDTALRNLQQVLKSWVDTAPVPPRPAAIPASVPGAPTTSAAPQLSEPAQEANLLQLATVAQAAKLPPLPAPVLAALTQLLEPVALGVLPSSEASGPAASPAAPAQAQMLAAPNLPRDALPTAVPPATEGADLNAALLRDAAPALQVLKAWIEAGAPAALPRDMTLDQPASGAARPPAQEVPVANSALPRDMALDEIVPALRQALAPSPGAASAAVAANAPAPAHPEDNAAITALLGGAVAAPPSAMLSEALPLLQQIFKIWFSAAAAEAPSAPVDTAALLPSATPADAANSSSSPPPSSRGAGSAPAASSSAPAHADAATLGARLLRETNAALSHHELLQTLSLAARQVPVQRDGQSAQWMFEMPFATPQGSAVAQFKVNRDGGKGPKGEYVPVWRARFSLDVEPMGPVHAEIVLSAAKRTWVSLWAERPASAARLQSQQGVLSKALKDSHIDAEVAFHTGAPRHSAAAGQFLDRQS